MRIHALQEALASLEGVAGVRAAGHRLQESVHKHPIVSLDRIAEIQCRLGLVALPGCLYYIAPSAATTTIPSSTCAGRPVVTDGGASEAVAVALVQVEAHPARLQHEIQYSKFAVLIRPLYLGRTEAVWQLELMGEDLRAPEHYLVKQILHTRVLLDAQDIHIYNGPVHDHVPIIHEEVLGRHATEGQLRSETLLLAEPFRSLDALLVNIDTEAATGSLLHHLQ
mmetsp:Transcript_36519/g.77729  ORF Transcript_36519/g.77729 Transcript_36519/m.77729 type:complete len:224 (+) Transcript_36519:315-986(+)